MAAGQQICHAPGFFPTEDIAERAHKIWDQEGRPLGRDLEHWLRAEQELQREFPLLEDAILSHKTKLTKKK